MTRVTFRILLLITVTASALADCEFGDQPIVLTEWTGSIVSPGFNKSVYPNNQNCTWLIRVGSGNTIRLTFDIFDIEEGFKENSGSDGKTKCEFDSVSITDSNRSLFEGCGKKSVLVPVNSITNRVVITFVSDDQNQRRGFRLNYTGICDINITHPGQIELPNFPHPPPVGLECHWFLPSANALTIVRLAQEINNLPFCSHTPITVRELETNRTYNVCLTDYLAFSHSDLELVYKVQPDDEPWGGKLEIAHEVTFNCSTFCKNDTSSNCTTAPSSAGIRYDCSCKDGYTGTNCEARLTDIDPCYSQPCFANGTCVPDGPSFKCVCVTGYSGILCQDDVNECLNDNACQNGGTCLNSEGSYKCVCLVGYVGSVCQTEIMECSSNPCPQNATCQDNVGSYECICPTGFKGFMCDIMTCSANPCHNGATCTDFENSFSCSCAAGFKGKVCDVPFDKCDFKPCQNGGTCTIDGSGFQCFCSEQYTGRYCSIPKGSAHCLEDTDSVFGSGITWADTLASQEDIQKCPKGILGSASRMCVYNSFSVTGGSWVRPDLSKCVSPHILAINKEANLLRVNDSVSSEVILDLARRLANATSVVEDDTGARLYPGDLAFAAGVIETIADAVLKASDGDVKMERMVQGYGEAVDNLIDPSTAVIWKNARATLVDEKVSSLLVSTETFADNLWRLSKTTRRRRAAHEQELTEDNASIVDITSKNMEFSITKFSEHWNKSALPPFIGHRGFSSIQLPAVVVDIVRKHRADEDVSVYYGKFPTVASLLSIREDRHNSTKDTDSTVVNSDVVSAKVMGVSKDSFQDLKQPVVITFAYKDVNLKNSLYETCVFLNMSALSSTDRWSTSGCKLDSSSNDTHAVCHCSHLTNFALLMDVYGTSKSLDEVNDTALSAVSYIGGCLSILACVMSIAVFEYFRLRNDRIRIHENLAASIICVQVVFLIGVGRTEKRSSIPEWACKTVAVLVHFFLTAMFCWMLVEGIHLYVSLVRVFKRGNHLKKYVGIGWGVPLIVVGISFAVFYEHYGDGDICWLNQDALLVCFVPTVGLVIIINTVVLIIVLKVMMRSLHSNTKVTVQEKSSLKMGLKATAILLPLLGLTWTLAFFTVNSERDLALVFTYLFTISNSFQGVMFFLFHCLLNVDVHSAFERRYPRKRTMSFVDTSLTKVKRLSSTEVCQNELSPRGKPSIDTQFTDITMNDSRHNSMSSNEHPHLAKRPSSYSDSYGSCHLRLISKSSQHSISFGNDHQPLDRRCSSGFEDFDAHDSNDIWRRYSMENDDAFPDVTKQEIAYHPDVVCLNTETKHRRNSDTLANYGE